MSRHTTFAAAALAALSLAACGSSSSHSSKVTTTTPAASTPTATTSSTPTGTGVSSTPTSTSATTTTGTSTTAAAGGTPAAFKAEMLALHPTAVALGEAVQAALEGANKMSNAQVAATFGALAAQARQVEAAMKKTHPPAADAQLLNTYASQFGTIADDLQSLSDAGKNGDAAAGKAGAEQLVKDAMVLVQDSTALKKAVLGHA